MGILGLVGESSCLGTPGSWQMESTDPCYATRASTDFRTMKVRGEFLAWLRQESARRGIFIYELVEELTSRSLAGKRPWRGSATRGSATRGTATRGTAISDRFIKRQGIP